MKNEKYLKESLLLNKQLLLITLVTVVTSVIYDFQLLVHLYRQHC